MTDRHDTNAEIWKSAEIVREWAATAAQRDATRVEHWATLARLLPFRPDESFTVVDLGAGTGAATRRVLEAFPHAEAICTDFSAEMIAEGTAALADFGGRARYVEFDMVAQTWPETLPAAADAVITSLCVHHLPDERKRGLFAEIHAHLRPGGWYFNYDPITTADPAVAATWERVGDIDDPSAPERRAHRSPTELARFENHVRYMVPLAPQLDWLVAAGFSGVDVYFKYLENVIYGGYRPR